MGRAGITYFDVSSVANKLAAQGKNPTVDAVREALGGTGSKSTLTPLLKRWKTENGLADAEVRSRLPAPLLQAVLALHEQLQADAERRVQEATDAHAVITADGRNRFDQLTARLSTVSQERDALAQQLEGMRHQNEQWRQQSHEQQLQLTRAEAEIASVLVRLADRQNEVAAVTQQLAALRDQFEHYQEASANQRDTERRQAQQQHSAQEQELGILRNQLNSTQQQLAERSTQLDGARQTLLRLETDLALAGERLNQEQTARQALTEQHQQLLGERNNEQRQATTMQAELALLQRAHADILQQLTAQQQENHELLQANAMLTAQLQLRPVT